jgi:hypothetical protein
MSAVIFRISERRNHNGVHFGATGSSQAGLQRREQVKWHIWQKTVSSHHIH